MSAIKPTASLDLLFISKVRLTTPGTARFHEFVEFSYIISGKCNYMIGDTTYLLGEGDYFFIDAYQLHHCTAILGEEPLCLFAAGISTQIQPYNDGYVHHTSESIRPYLHTLINEMQQENREKKPFYRLKLVSCMTEFATTVLRDQLPKASGKPESTQSISYKEQHIQKAALQYINQHYLEPVHLEDIASSIPVSPSYLNKLFQKTMHTSPMQHVIWLRLKKAVSLMDTTPSISVREAALRSGYPDLYQFSKLFKKHVGVTPTQYLSGKRAKKF